MSHQPAYDINAEWIDPTEPRQEHRLGTRFPIQLKLGITVESGGKKRHLIGPGIVINISSTGARVLTKHNLAKGQTISLAIPTTYCPESMALPEAFMGTAKAIWTTPQENDTNITALAFNPQFKQNMEFLVFIEHLQIVSKTMATM